MHWSPVTILLGIFAICLVLYGIQQLRRFIRKKPSKSNVEEEVYTSKSNLNYNKYKADNPEYDKYKADIYYIRNEVHQLVDFLSYSDHYLTKTDSDIMENHVLL